tara:strand:+ start:537 stop:1418 length:882 start_codon:yes stop_codon:yes gene_type:complete
MIQIFEVSPRDGIQNMVHAVSSEEKLALITLLQEAGIKKIEVTSFVNPKRVPNMADAEDVYETAAKPSDGELSVLVPNKRGIERAKSVGATKFNIFFSPNDEFNVENYGLRLPTILKGYYEALEGIPTSDVRVYISMAFAADLDPLEKAIVSGLEYGDTIVLCDTDGTASPFEVITGIDVAKKYTDQISVHLHHGRNLMDNVESAYNAGVREFDSSVGGLGGCPFVPGAGANLATEDLVKWADKKGIEHGVDREKLKDAVRLAKKIKNPSLRIAINNKIKETQARIKSVVTRK